MTDQANELQAINTAWQIAIQEILRMVARDVYKSGTNLRFELISSAPKRRRSIAFIQG
jgi:hypothetical protein